MAGRVAGKVAFITGAARGQGRSHAVRLAEEGADIIAVDLCTQVESVAYPLSTPEDLAQTVKLVESHDRRIIARQADVRDFAAITAVVEEGMSAFGRLDIVSANAGIVSYGPILDFGEQAWHDIVDTNLTGVWHTAKAAVPHMIAGGRGGSVVLTSSAAGVQAYNQVGHYVAAKHGVIGLMRSLALELGDHMIRVNSILPTQVNTGMMMNDYTLERFSQGSAQATLADQARISQSMHVLPVPWVEAVDISNAMLFLVSDEARYITGVALPVDCGVLIK